MVTLFNLVIENVIPSYNSIPEVGGASSLAMITSPGLISLENSQSASTSLVGFLFSGSFSKNAFLISSLVENFLKSESHPTIE